jgi:hypothetical protein
MAQAHSKSKPVSGLSDVNYNLITTLAEDLEAVDVLNTYIDDCRKAGDQDLERVFTEIRDDEVRHCEMLKKAVEDRCRQGKFE